jgi:hypothetical protein
LLEFKICLKTERKKHKKTKKSEKEKTREIAMVEETDPKKNRPNQ